MTRREVGNCLLVGLCLVLLLAGTTVTPAAEEIKGTTDEQLKQLTLPSPAGLPVALLPFTDSALVERHVDQLRDALMMQFCGEGFTVPHPAIVRAVVVQDKKLEPGQAMRKDDAVRLGRRLGAKWAVYGTINQCEAYYKTSFFSTQRKCKVALQLNIVNVETEELFFWQQRADVTGGGFFSGGLFGKGAAAVERDGLYICSNSILKRLFAVLPPHDKAEFKFESYPYLNRDACAAAYKAKPDDLATALNYGEALLCAGAVKEAGEVLGKLLAANPNNADVHFWNGVNLLASGATDKAVAEWQETLKLDAGYKLATEQINLAAGG